jgi:hypothetical protein
MCLKNKLFTLLWKTILVSGFLLFFFHFTLAGEPVHASVKYRSITIIYDKSTQTVTSIPGTPTHTPTTTSTPSVTPTTTLLPLPAITLIFPVSTSTSTATITPKITYFAPTPTPSDLSDSSTLSPRFTLLFVLLIFLWIFLAGFVIIYIRQFK